MGQKKGRQVLREHLSVVGGKAIGGIAGPSPASSPSPSPKYHDMSKLVNVQGNSIFCSQTGTRSSATDPIVVIVCGLGSVTDSWSSFIRLLSPSLPIFCYDRLGLGNSPRTNIDRPARVLATELKETLLAAKVEPPYILVAHSYGGIIAREFLDLHDSEVVGLVYVDANHEDAAKVRQWPHESWDRVTDGLDFDTVTGASTGHNMTPTEWEMVEKRTVLNAKEKQETGTTPAEGEMKFYATSLEALGKRDQLTRRALGDRPFSVIMANLERDFRLMYEAGCRAGKGTDADREHVEAFVKRLPEVELKLNSDLLRLSSRHRMVITSTSGHMVQYWEPEVIVDEVLWVARNVAR